MSELNELKRPGMRIQAIGALKAVQARLPNLLQQAAQQEPGYSDFLLDVLKTEAGARGSRYLRARLEASKTGRLP